MKKGQVTIFILIAVILVGYIVITTILKEKKEIDLEINECQTDVDCVPATCCHPTECAPVAQKPDCSEILCTEECKQGTLDCNQGNCACINNKCAANLNG